MDDLRVPVEVPCPCPGTPHPDGDMVFLRSKLGLAGGSMLQRLAIEANQARPDAADLTGMLAEAYLRVGVSGWTFVDVDGAPVPVTADSLQSWLLDDFALAAPIADKADELYLGPVLLPLVKAGARRSPSTTTAASTSRTSRGSAKNRKRSARSSTSTTQTDYTETTTS